MTANRRTAPHIVRLLPFLVVAACSAPEDPAIPGYVEADLIYLSSEESGRIAELLVAEGDQIAKGEPVFRIDAARLALGAAGADAAAEAIAARVGVAGSLERAVEEAQAQARLARQNFNRSRKLLAEGVVTRARYDADAAALNVAEAGLERAIAERDAAAKDSAAAAASAGLAARRLADIETHAPADGAIERIYLREGEFASAGAPVMALLPPGNIDVRFFAPEPLLSKLAVGGEISFTCDGCGDARRARIRRIAHEPQFTPPVIYSAEARDKLVYLVEARPVDPAGLRPGLPVSVTISAASE